MSTTPQVTQSNQLPSQQGPGGGTLAEIPRVLLLESTPAADLPGFLRKRLVVGGDEIGLVISGGQVDKKLMPGKHGVAWAFLGYTFGKKTAVKLRSKPFTLSLSFYRLQTKDYLKFDCLISVSVSIESAEIFYKEFGNAARRVTSDEVARTFAGPLDSLVQARSSAYIAEALLHDLTIGEQLGSELRPLLEQLAGDKGMKLQGTTSIRYTRPAEEEVSLAEELEELQARSKSTKEDAQAQIKAAREWVLGKKLHLSSSKIKRVSDGMETLADSATGSSGEAIKNLMEAVQEHIEERIASKAAQLTSTAQGAPTAPKKRASLMSRVETAFRVLVIVAPLGTLAFYFFKRGMSVTEATQLSNLARAGTYLLPPLAALIALRINRLMKEHREEVPRIKLDRWVKEASLMTDETIRRQIGRELSTTVTTLKAAKLDAYRGGNRPIADALTKVEDAASVLQSDIERAAFGSTVATPKTKPGSTRIARMVQFEQDVLHQTRVLGAAAEKLRDAISSKGPVSQEEIRDLEHQLEELRKLFSQRMAHLEGFIIPRG